MIITGILLIVYYFMLTAVMGTVVFSKYLLYCGILLIVFCFLNKRFKKNKRYKNITTKIKPILIFCAAFFILIESVIVAYSFVKNTDDADYLIILGAGLRGEAMTMTLRHRMEDSYSYYQNYKNCKYIIVSGGQGPGESISEAEAMERYLLSMGVEQNKIIKEDKSTSTYENLEFSKRIIEKHSNKSVGDVAVKLATSNFHSLRTYLIAKKCGYKNITSYGCRINPIFIPTYYSREFFALVKTIFDFVYK